MVGKSQSQRSEQKEKGHTRDACLDYAVEIQKEEHETLYLLLQKEICQKAAKEYYDKTGKTILLSTSTLDCCIKGGLSPQQAGEQLA